MADYLLLYSGGSMPETEEEQAAVMTAWTDWFGGLGKAVKDGGNPFTGQAKSIASDGAVGDSAGSASGYSVLEADSLDAAVEWRRAARCFRAVPRSRNTRLSR